MAQSKFAVCDLTGAPKAFIGWDETNLVATLYEASDGTTVIRTLSKQYKSGTRTGTGAAETIAHGLAAIPASVDIVALETGVTISDVYCDITNVYCTVTTGKTYRVKATV
jgi:hypothetical protein